MTKEIIQFAFDVERSEDMTEEMIKEILLNAGLNVLGVAWKATWDSYDDYMNGVCSSWD